MSLPNRHPVDELADLRKQMRQIEQRIEELRELIISGACSLVGDEHAAPASSASVTGEGWLVHRGSDAWLCGDRRQALREFSELERIERRGSA